MLEVCWCEVRWHIDGANVIAAPLASQVAYLKCESLKRVSAEMEQLETGTQDAPFVVNRLLL